MNDSKEKQSNSWHSHSSESEEEEEPQPEDENNSLYMSQIQYKELNDRSKKVGSVETIRWLRKRHLKTTKKPYLMSDSENKHIQQIKTVFSNFDFDGSKTLDAEEVFQMLEQNNIDIPIPILKSLFAIVKPRNQGELRMGEFIKFSFDETANKKFRKLIQKIRSNLKEESLTKQSTFLPFAFPTLLNYLSQKATRQNLLKQIKKNQLKVDLVFDDIKMFEDLLTLSQKSEKTEGQENYIFREIKLEKELNKLKKRISKQMTKEELRMLLPYEEFLSRALLDEESDIDENENDLTSNYSLKKAKNLEFQDSKEIIIQDEDKEQRQKIQFNRDGTIKEEVIDEFIMNTQRIKNSRNPIIKINDQSPSAFEREKQREIIEQQQQSIQFSINQEQQRENAQEQHLTGDDLKQTLSKRASFIKKQGSVDVNHFKQESFGVKSDLPGSLSPVRVNQQLSSPQPKSSNSKTNIVSNQNHVMQTLQIKKILTTPSQAQLKQQQQIDELLSQNSLQVISEQGSKSTLQSHRSIIPQQLLKNSYQKREQQRFDEDLQQKIEQAREEQLEKVSEIIKQAQFKALKQKRYIVQDFLREQTLSRHSPSKLAIQEVRSQRVFSSNTQFRASSNKFLKYQKQNQMLQNGRLNTQTHQISSVLTGIKGVPRNIQSGLVEINDDPVLHDNIRTVSSSLQNRSRKGMNSHQSQRTFNPTSSQNYFSTTQQHFIPNTLSQNNLITSTNSNQFQRNLPIQSAATSNSQYTRDVTTAATYSTLQGARILGGEPALLNQKQVRSQIRKFDRNEYKHFGVMLKMTSPKSKHGGASPNERMRLLKESMMNVVGDALHTGQSNIKYEQNENEKQKWKLTTLILIDQRQIYKNITGN
eukprot:403373099